jgi:protein tyrosine phosphatase (PTP) superfamily phosphohydrolase (DUF442 family)
MTAAGFVLTASVLALLAGAAGCQSSADAKSEDMAQTSEQPAGKQGTVAYDRGIWQSLLTDHKKIRRVVTFRADGVDAVTESDDADVARRIKDHAQRMKIRIDQGATVRFWDPVFSELFENHDKIKLAVTVTEKGVSISESSEDPAVVSLLHAHASGLSDFVREGHAAGRRETARVDSAGLIGRTIITIGGEPLRFDRTAPDAAALDAAKSAGVTTVIDFRKSSESTGFDEKSGAEAVGLKYTNIPFQNEAELTDEVFDATRESLKGLKGTALMHCRSGNRAAAAWLPYRVLDEGVSWDRALAEAKAIGLKAPALEAKAKDYIDRHEGK